MNLEKIVKDSRQLGLMGVAIVYQGGATPYMAACLGQSGDVCDPRNYDTHATAESALSDLGQKLENLIEHKAKRQAKAVA